jgi:hypothetical protein
LQVPERAAFPKADEEGAQQRRSSRSCRACDDSYTDGAQRKALTEAATAMLEIQTSF